MPVTGKLLLNAPLAEQNHMKKASEIAVIAMAFSDSKWPFYHKVSQNWTHTSLTENYHFRLLNRIV